MLPPMDETDWLEGSGAKNKPAGSAASETARFLTPGSTIANRASASICTMRRILDKASTTLSDVGVAPPEIPVPAPRETIGVPAALRAFTTACTCNSSSGSTAASGRARFWTYASISNAARRSRSSITDTDGASPSSAAMPIRSAAGPGEAVGPGSRAWRRILRSDAASAPSSRG